MKAPFLSRLFSRNEDNFGRHGALDYAHKYTQTRTHTHTHTGIDGHAHAHARLYTHKLSHTHTLTRLIDMCDMILTCRSALMVTNSCHDSLICVTWLIDTCDMTHWYVWHELIDVRHDSLMCATWLIHVRHDSFLCVTRPIQVMTLFACVTWLWLTGQP